MLIRQPNGKICICSWDGTVERMNLTEDEYTAYCIGLAKEEIKKIWMVFWILAGWLQSKR